MAQRRSGQLTRRELISLIGGGAGLAVATGFAGRRQLEAAAQTATRGGQSRVIPPNAVIRTILKDVPPQSLGPGATLIHEHLTAGGNIDVLVDEVKAAHNEGVGCIVDAATNRRNDMALDRLRTLASRTGMTVIVAGGYFEDIDNLQTNYPPQVAKMSEAELVEEFVKDAAAQRWGAFGEIGTSNTMRDDERKVIRAIAKAHKRTGLPIFTHTPHDSCPSCALEQLEIFQSEGVDPQKLVIGHLSEILHDPTAALHKRIAKTGVFLGFDTVGHFLPHSPDQTDAMRVKMVMALVDAGFEDQIVLSSDLGRTQDLKSNWGSGYSTVVTVFVPKLRYAGLKEATIQKILVENPRRFLAFVPKSA
jgi:phosphotriesterase-related protein